MDKTSKDVGPPKPISGTGLPSYFKGFEHGSCMGLVCWSELRSRLTVSLRGLSLVFFLCLLVHVFFSSLRDVFWKKHLQEHLSMFHPPKKKAVVDRFLATTYDKVSLRVFVF